LRGIVDAEDLRLACSITEAMRILSGLLLIILAPAPFLAQSKDVLQSQPFVFTHVTVIDATVLGDRDTADRVREAEAMAQGGNRFARGLRFFAAATEEANVLKVPLAWRLRIAYGADHSPNAAVQVGFEELLR
jgi:hypothetical protein